MSGVRVVVTGIGIVSPLACGARAHFDRILAGDSAVVRLEDPAYRNYPPLLHARVNDFDRREMIPDRMLRKLLSPSSGFALAAATEALRDARLLGTDLSECGLYSGSVSLEANPEAFVPALRESVNPSGQVDLSLFARNGMKLIDPLFLVRSLPNAGLCAIAIQHQVLGPNANITNGPVSGLQSVIAAAAAIRRGDASMALAGAYDSLLQMDCIVDHMLAGRLASENGSPSKSCRPFDRRRTGYALSEGACFLILEDALSARRRGVPSYGEILYHGEALSPEGFLDPDAAGDGALAAAAGRAMAPESLPMDLVFTDALAIARDDGHEAAAYAALFGTSGPPVTGSTPAIGFTGAAGASFSVAHALLAMHRQIAPPMINCVEPVHALPIVQRAAFQRLRRALVWSSDRGVKNAALVVGSDSP